MGFIRRGSRVFLIRREGESQNSASAEIKSAVTERQLIRQRRNEIQQQQQQQHHQQQHRSNRIGTPPQQPPHHQPDQQPLQHHRSDSLEVLTTDLDFYECTFSPDTYRPKAPVPPFTPGTSSPVDHAPADTPTDTTTTMSPGNRYSSDNYDRCVVSLLHGHKRHLLVTSMTSEEIGDRLTVAHMQKAVSKVTGIPCHRQHLVVGTTRLDLNPGAILSDMALTEKTLVRVQSTNAQNFAKNEEHFSKTMAYMDTMEQTLSRHVHTSVNLLADPRSSSCLDHLLKQLRSYSSQLSTFREQLRKSSSRDTRLAPLDPRLGTMITRTGHLISSIDAEWCLRSGSTVYEEEKVAKYRR